MDFSDLKAQVPILKAIEIFNFGPFTEYTTEKGEQAFRGRCPFCNAHDARKFVVTPSKQAWYCFNERKGGSVIDLAARHYNCSLKVAADKLSAALQSKGEPKAEPKEKSSTFDTTKFLMALHRDHEALEPLGLSRETLEYWKAGYCTRPSLRNKLAVAICDIKDEIKFFVGIDLESHELQVPEGFVLPYWFGVNRVVPGELRIVPEIMDVLQAYESGVTNLICPLRPVDGDALQCLRALVLERNLTVIF